jgi:hypothetical protein
LLVLELLGCATTSKPVSPHTLSNADLNTVALGLHAALKDLNSPKFRMFRASQATDGKIYVCGWVSDSEKYADERPFVGTLFAGQFAVDHIAKHQSEKDFILSECNGLGIPLL